ncbi:uncharacterized protein B0P05DRAFT_529904, partial [Gilbertella persicaria]|uniref:uncharacterized protein n=1 Tax=Gilbertella persicaria TaxID=101096 RepID=UPI00221F70C2
MNASRNSASKSKRFNKENMQDENEKIVKNRDRNSRPMDPQNITNMATLLKARLQYAQIKMETGLSTEGLQKTEPAFISSPKQPRRPLPSEYPPYPTSSTPQSRKSRRMLLSATTNAQNVLRKRRLEKEKDQQSKQDEAAAFTILMLRSSSERSDTRLH